VSPTAKNPEYGDILKVSNPFFEHVDAHSANSITKLTVKRNQSD